MAGWTLYCPHCGAANRVPADELDLECGTVSHSRACGDCGKAFTIEQAYWRWLGLKEPPPAEGENREVDDSVST